MTWSSSFLRDTRIARTCQRGTHRSGEEWMALGALKALQRLSHWPRSRAAWQRRPSCSRRTACKARMCCLQHLPAACCATCAAHCAHCRQDRRRQDRTMPAAMHSTTCVAPPTEPSSRSPGHGPRQQNQCARRHSHCLSVVNFLCAGAAAQAHGAPARGADCRSPGAGLLDCLTGFRATGG